MGGAAGGDRSPPGPSADAMRAARIAVGGLFFLCGLAFASWASRIPQVQEALALSPAALGAALAGLGAGSFVAMPVSGWLTLRGGRRPGVVLAAAVSVFGAALGFLDVAMNAQAVELEHRAGRPVMSGFHALFSAGGMTGGALGGGVAARHGPGAIHILPP